MLNGWIKLHRSTLEHWINNEPELLAVWVRLLLEANHYDVKKMFNGSLVTIKRGELIFGLNAFSEKSGVSISKLRRCMRLLESDSMISRQKTNKYSIISIVNYSLYQVDDSQGDKQNASRQQSDEKQATSQRQHRKNVKNENNDKNVKKYTESDLKIAKDFYQLLLRLNPKHKEPNYDRWAEDIRRTREIDNRTHKEIEELILWSNNHNFWQKNILSPGKLRAQWDKLIIQKNSAGNGRSTTKKVESFENRNYGEFGDI